jgi:hypothetical protein
MIKSEAITAEQIEELLRFLPVFDVPGRKFVERWAGGTRTEDGAITAPSPIYADDVLAFFQLAGQPLWSDYEYDPAEVRRRVEDDACIASATLEDIKSMLTYCVRGERFCDGHWEAILESGRVTVILRRLAVLKESLSAQADDGQRRGDCAAGRGENDVSR